MPRSQCITYGDMALISSASDKNFMARICNRGGFSKPSPLPSERHLSCHLLISRRKVPFHRITPPPTNRPSCHWSRPPQENNPKRSVRSSADPTHVGLGIIWRPQILMAHQTSGYVSTADGQTAVFRASLTPKMDVWMEQWKNRRRILHSRQQ